MATWMVHFRIADYFLEKLQGIDQSEFVIGSIAPDCGYGNKDSFGDFMPPPEVTHWTPSGRKKDCRYKDFYKKYLKGRQKNKAYSFYLGYYVHLLTDIMWSSEIYIPTRIKYAVEYEENPEFLKVIKEDWNDLDHKFLIENPKFRPYDILRKKDNVEDYLPYFEPNQLTVQSKSIVEFYADCDKPKEKIYRDYKYLTEDEVSVFISCANELIEKDLIRKDLM